MRRCPVMVRRPAVVLAVAVLAMAPAAAEDDRVVDAVEAQAASQPQPQQLIDLGANFDANLFEQQGNGWVLRGDGPQVRGRVIVNGRQVLPPPSVDEARPPESPSLARARAVADRRLARIDEACDLDDDQKRKLRLAVESDIRRFVDDVDAVRRRYSGVRVNLGDQEGQKRWNLFQQDVQRCRQQLRGLLDSGSLFSKVLATTLDERQLVGIEREATSRRSFRWRAMVVAAVVRMDDTLGLSQAQHDLIEEALLANEPRLRVDELSPQQENDHLQQTLVSMVLSGVDTSRIKAAVSDRQWRSLALLMNQGKAMRSWIEQQGILEPAAP